MDDPNDADGSVVAWTGLVKGRVQGVFFRAETQRVAIELGVAGWVRNTLEGHVELLISGTPEAIGEMRIWLKEGPSLARVDALELLECPAVDVPGFEIRY